MHVFLSYARGKDDKLARAIAESVQEAGHEIWFDERELVAGENWALKIGKALEEANAMLVLVSPESMRSPWVQQEISYALGSPNYANRLVPVYAQPTENVPWIFCTLNSVHLGRKR